jgi:DNA adenine methylase
MANTIGKSPITYYGGKTSIMPHILPLVPVHDTYTETFFGGGELFWSKTPAKNETINDRLDVVVNFYRVLRNDFKRLRKLIDATLISRTIYNEANNYLRAHKYGIEVDRVQLAWAFWMGSNFSHMHKLMGGYKQQKSGGKSIARELVNKKKEFTDRLVTRIENATIENAHWQVVADARDTPTTFHHFDPTYPGTERGSHFPFTWNDYEALLEWCEACKGKFLLCSYPSPVLSRFIKRNEWLRQDVIHELKAARKGGEQTHKNEVIVTNYSTACGTLKLF